MRESPRIRRLRNDRKALEKLRSESTILDFDATGDPADKYIVRFYGKGLWRPNGSSSVMIRELHEVRIVLGASYPRMMPELSWVRPSSTPTSRPVALSVWVDYGTHWVPSLSLDELCEMLWDMIRYQNFDVESPYNREAALWAKTQTTYVLPLDGRSIRDRVANACQSGSVESCRAASVRRVRSRRSTRACRRSKSSKTRTKRSLTLNWWKRKTKTLCSWIERYDTTCSETTSREDRFASEAASWENATRTLSTSYVFESVLEQILDYSEQDLTRELGGFLLGGYHFDETPYVEVRHFLEAVDARSGAASLTFTHETWATMTRGRAGSISRRTDRRLASHAPATPSLPLGLRSCSSTGIFSNSHGRSRWWSTPCCRNSGSFNGVANESSIVVSLVSRRDDV